MEAVICKLGFSPLAHPAGFGLVTLCRAPVQTLHSSTEKRDFLFFLFAVQIQILQTGPSVNSLLLCSVHIKL